jgi:uncharacterized membrane protein YphA (DoxX/SURF4 family)
VTRNHSRVTGALRLLVAVWLIASAVRTLADPQQATRDSSLPLSVLLPWAGLSFAVGAFLLTGFMSRVCGLLLVGMGVWHAASFGVSSAPLVLIAVGCYVALRGGGAWAMDIYVQKMQDRVRMRDVNSPESSLTRSRG